mmetsp:Transcript_8367/g.30596  ORF Transcript_8367/g.30596 Transcript_8367/m.30596 type:complete len:228 (-) Transcript_8367:4-687(-)
MIHFTSRTISLPRYSIPRRTSVVITMHVAFLLMHTSPVMRPTSAPASPPNSSASSRNFWFDSALIGEVYITLCLSRNAIAMAYSATTVFPADVCAATITLSFLSRTAMEVSWNASRTNGYALARAPSYVGLFRASRSPSQHSGIATWCTHDVRGGGGRIVAASSALFFSPPPPTSSSPSSSSRLRFLAASRTAFAPGSRLDCAVGMSAEATDSSSSAAAIAPAARAE